MWATETLYENNSQVGVAIRRNEETIMNNYFAELKTLYSKSSNTWSKNANKEKISSLYRQNTKCSHPHKNMQTKIVRRDSYMF